MLELKEVLLQIKTVSYMLFVIYLHFNFCQKLLVIVSIITKYFWCFARQSQIVLHAKQFSFCYLVSIIFSDLSFSNALPYTELLVPSNFSTSNLAFITNDLEVVEDFNNSSRVDYGAEEFEDKTCSIIFIKVSPL